MQEDNKLYLVGYGYLKSHIDNEGLPYYRQSFIKESGGYKIEETSETISYYYPKTIKKPSTVLEHIEFALKYEGLNLSLLTEIFKQIPEIDIENYININKKGKYQRLIWFLYEYLTENTLNIEDIATVNYVDLLDKDSYYTAKPIKHKRYCVNENLLGNKNFAPIVRKTPVLKEFEEKKLDETLKSVINDFDPYIVHRVVNYLYTRETIETYEIEGEKPSKDRQVRFQNVLKNLDTQFTDISKETFLNLQNLITDKRFQDNNYRKTQIFVGIRALGSSYKEQTQVFYIAPDFKDVKELMPDFINFCERIKNSTIPPVVKAAIIAFSFVYIHPFRDGNGRIHRLLIHKILSDEKFTPENTIIPISATMLKNRREYDKALEVFSEPLMEILDYSFDSDGFILPKNNFSDYYRHIDLTKQSEYLYACIETTINVDFTNEVKFLSNYDKAKVKIQGIADLPDNLIDLFINITVKNNGKLSINKRKKFFKELTNSELDEMEKIVQSIFDFKPV